MSVRPQKPQKGISSIKALYKTICQIIDYLPSLELQGDGKNTYITKSRFGSTIHIRDTSKKVQNVESGNTIINEGILAKITNINQGNGMRQMTATLYPDGKDGPAGDIVTVINLNYGITSTLELNDWIIVYPSKLKYAGGND